MASLLLVAGLVLFALLGSSDDSYGGPLFQLTGEENLLPQIKGLTDLAADAMRPRLQTSDLTPMAHAGGNPFGGNVVLGEEAEEVPA